MKSNISSKHLSRNFPCFKGLTLPELKKTVFVFLPCFFLAGFVIGLFMHKAFGMALLMLIVGLIFSVGIAPKFIAKMKYGLPEGYLIKKFKIFFEKLLMKKSSYIFHEGRWVTSKSLGDKNV
tara:strand:- start:111 stop:476 length:366 start_codon:yes stop_codon:yes gene_type:complete